MNREIDMSKLPQVKHWLIERGIPESEYKHLGVKGYIQVAKRITGGQEPKEAVHEVHQKQQEEVPF